MIRHLDNSQFTDYKYLDNIYVMFNNSCYLRYAIVNFSFYTQISHKHAVHLMDNGHYHLKTPFISPE